MGRELVEKGGQSEAPKEVPSNVRDEIRQIEQATDPHSHAGESAGLQGVYNAFKQTENNWPALEKMLKDPNSTPEQFLKAIAGNDATIKGVQDHITNLNKLISATGQKAADRLPPTQIVGA